MMNMGVSYDLYWSGDPFIVSTYAEAYELAREREGVETDIAAWRTGMYVLEAIGSAFDKNTQYPEEPHLITERKQADVKTAVEAAFAEFKALTSVYNARMRKSRDSAQADVTAGE